MTEKGDALLRLEISGNSRLRHAARILEAGLVDVVYVEEVRPDSILLLCDEGVDPRAAADLEWLRKVVSEALHHGGFDHESITLEPVPPSS